MSDIMNCSVRRALTKTIWSLSSPVINISST
uniref:Uncharacterized protein n=1 Tax=Arundo donax TaxID=35708 RepID=A0A0A9TEZ7_ARUDO